MKADGLMVGNYILDPEGKIIKIHTIQREYGYIDKSKFDDWCNLTFQNQELDDSIFLKNCNPIPVTEDILLNSGFEKFVMTETEKLYSMDMTRNRRLQIAVIGDVKLIQITSSKKTDPYIPTDFVCLFNEDYDGKLFLHKLQNIVFDLTEKELSIEF